MGKETKLQKTQIRVLEIANLLESGKERKDILQIFSEKYNAKPRTVDNLLKAGREIVAERNLEREKTRVEVMTATVTEAAQEAIISDMEIEAILCKIVTGGIEVEEVLRGECIVRGVTPFEMIAAADKLWKKRGTYAAEKKIDITEPIIIEWKKPLNEIRADQ